LRVLTLSNSPLDASLGSGYVILGYADGLRARGHEVDLLGPPDYEPLHGLARGIRYKQALGMAAASVRRVAREAYDVLEFYGGEAWLAISLLTRVPGRRFLVVCHSNGLETHCAQVMRGAEEPVALQHWYQVRHEALFAWGFRGADAIVTVAQYDRDYALRRGYKTSRQVIAIDNPLPEAFLGLQVDFERGPVIGYCGSWLPRKGVDLIQRDIPPLLREFPAWRLVLVGVGSGFRAEEHFPADVLPQISVIPYADRETDLRSLYQSFAIAIVPSLYESFGLSAAEAMACGCALVATRVGFSAGARDGEDALLLHEPVSPSLYGALKSLIDDEGLRERIARAGYRRVQSLLWDDAITVIESAYLCWLAELRAAESSVDIRRS